MNKTTQVWTQKYTYTGGNQYNAEFDSSTRPDWVSPALCLEEKTDPSFAMLMQMHTYKRPAWSATEEEFIERYLDSLPDMKQDLFGNRYLTVRQASGIRSKVMWSCHTDTVHRTEGRQKITFGSDEFLRLNKSDKANVSNCLGGDDTAGVWLLLELIEAGIPGTYVFHRAEEIGGQGSTWIEGHRKAWLKEHDYCIAMDRKGWGSIITDQHGTCCSDAFCTSLGDMLRLPLFKDTTGSFTDSANYIEHIPECTNVSVGYFKQHTANEVLDVRFLYILRDAIIADFEEAGLVVERKAEKVVPVYTAYKRPNILPKTLPTTQAAVDYPPGPNFEALVRNYPDIAVKILEDCGFTQADFEEEIFMETGLQGVNWYI